MLDNQASLFDTVDLGPQPLVLSYGMGVDSTAVLVLWWQLGIRPDLIIFADTGSEHPRTYAYRRVIDLFLNKVGFPAITVVRYQPGHGHYNSLLTDCLIKGMMPSLAYGMKGCSQKYKAGPITAYLKTWPVATAAWSRGQRLLHAIGYDAGPKDSRRGTDDHDNKLEQFVYPLRAAGWDRERCESEIENNPVLQEIGRNLGVNHVPPKSACVFCPSTKPCEVDAMAEEYPTAAVRALLVEAEALPRSTSVAGLWRKPTKARPASWGEYLAPLADVLPPAPEVASELFPNGCAGAPGDPPPEGIRFAVGKGEEQVFVTDFRSAVLAAKGGRPLYFWMAGKWFTSLAQIGSPLPGVDELAA